MAQSAQKRPEFDAGHVPMTEEMDSANRTLPPFLPMLIAFILVGGILALYFYFFSKPPAYRCHIAKAVLVPVHSESAPQSPFGITELDVDKETHDMVVLLVQLQIKDTGSDPLYLKSISAVLSTPKGDSEDTAASGSDYDRLFQAYPVLTAYQEPPVSPNLKISPGQEVNGAEVFGFPIALKDFQQSKSLKLDLFMYNYSIVLPLQPDQIQVLAPPEPAGTHKK